MEGTIAGTTQSNRGQASEETAQVQG